MNKYVRLTLVIIVCLYFWHYAATYTDWHFIDNANLIFHEAGHAIFMLFGQFIYIAAGSAFQVAFPLFFSIYFLATGRKISGALCLLWVGQNLLNVSIYAGDAVSMKLDLLGGDSSIHDWNYLLNALGALRYTPIIASVIYYLGMATITLGTALSLIIAGNDELQSTHKFDW